MCKSDPVVLGLSANEPSTGTSPSWKGSVKSEIIRQGSVVVQVVYRGIPSITNYDALMITAASAETRAQFESFVPCHWQLVWFIPRLLLMVAAAAPTHLVFI